MTLTGLSVEDPELPPAVAKSMNTAVAFVESYGWFMLIGGILAYLCYNKIKAKVHHHQVFSKPRS